MVIETDGDLLCKWLHSRRADQGMQSWIVPCRRVLFYSRLLAATLAVKEGERDKAGDNKKT